MVCGGLVPAPAFSSVDKNALRKPNRFILSNVVRKPPRMKHSAKLMRKNETDILRNPNAQSKSLSAHPCNHPFAAKHMLFLLTHSNSMNGCKLSLKERQKKFNFKWSKLKRTASMKETALLLNQLYSILCRCTLDMEVKCRNCHPM